MRARGVLLLATTLACGTVASLASAAPEPDSAISKATRTRGTSEDDAPRNVPPPSAPSGDRRALSTAAALVPGALVHGSGHFALGESETGGALLAAEGVGLGMVAGGTAVLFLSGASRYLVAPAATVTILGVGVFGASFAADLYGALSSDGGAAALVPRSAASLESELGYRHVSDPRFSYEHFVVEGFSLRSGRWRVTPSGWFATNGVNARYRVEGAYRLLGPLPAAPRHWSDELDVVAGALHHRYAPEHFERTGGELAVQSRYDLGHWGRTLRGAFVEAGVGCAIATIHYDLRGLEVPNDIDALLLTSFGFGVVLRGRAAPGSLVRVYYDHRHDDIASGLLAGGLGSGVPGHFGAEARWFFASGLGLSLEAQAGSALVAGASLLFRRDAVPHPKERP